MHAQTVCTRRSSSPRTPGYEAIHAQTLEVLSIFISQQRRAKALLSFVVIGYHATVDLAHVILDTSVLVKRWEWPGDEASTYFDKI